MYKIKVFLMLFVINSVICGPVRTDRENQRTLLYAPAPPPPPPPTLPPIDFWDLPGFLPNEFGKTITHADSARSLYWQPPETSELSSTKMSPLPPPPPPPPTLPPLDLSNLDSFPVPPNDLDESTATRKPELMGRSLDPSVPQYPALSTATFNDWMKLMGPFVYWSTMAAINSVLKNLPLQKDFIKIEPNVDWNLNHDVKQTTVEFGDIVDVNNRFKPPVEDKVTEHKKEQDLVQDEHNKENEHNEERDTVTEIEEPLYNVDLNFDHEKLDKEKDIKEEHSEPEEKSYEKENIKDEHDQDGEHRNSDPGMDIQKNEKVEHGDESSKHIETEGEPELVEHKELEKEPNEHELVENGTNVHILEQGKHEGSDPEHNEPDEPNKYGLTEHDADSYILEQGEHKESEKSEHEQVQHKEPDETNENETDVHKPEQGEHEESEKGENDQDEPNEHDTDFHKLDKGEHEESDESEHDQEHEKQDEPKEHELSETVK